MRVAEKVSVVNRGVINIALEEEAADKIYVEAIKMDIELFIRIMEYAREDAKTDQELHQLTERVESQSRNRVLTMKDYDSLVEGLRQTPDDPNASKGEDNA